MSAISGCIRCSALLKNVIQKISLTISTSLEDFFYFWGKCVAQRPLVFITGCILFTASCGVGLLRFTEENRPDKLWIPTTSDFLSDSNWLRDNFPAPVRFQHAILAGDDVLQPQMIELLLDIHNRIRDIKTSGNKNYADLCFKLPVTKFDDNLASGTKRTKRWSDNETFFDDDFFLEDSHKNQTASQNQDFDPSVDLPVGLYCEIINSLDEACWENNIAEIWNFNSTLIKSLTKEDILESINRGNIISPVFGRPVNFTLDIGGITKNSTGHIVKAKAVLLRWFNRINYTASLGDIVNDHGTGEIVDTDNFEWEKIFVQVMENVSLPEGVELYFRVARGFGDVGEDAIWKDARMLSVGFMIVFVYVILMLGKCNLIEQRPFLSLAGLTSVAFATVVSYGLCSMLRLVYGPVHNILPFLLLGIGIDDMFVIMESWNNLPQSKLKASLPEQVGFCLKHSGVSITITSVTDFIAFAIGGTTVLPALQSFCIYAACGIIFTYVFQATFFTACLALDNMRIKSKRDAFLVCYKHKGDSVTGCGDERIAQRIFGGVYSDVLLSRPAKIFILCLTLTFAGFGIWGNAFLRQEFDPMWFLPHESYMFQYYLGRDAYFPGMGLEAIFVLGNFSFYSHLGQLHQFIDKLDSSPSVYDVDAWYPHFKDYGNKHFNLGIPSDNLTEKQFDKYISKFLFSPTGSRFRGRFKFDGNISCGRPAPRIEISMITFKFNTFLGPEEQIPAMHEIKNLIKHYFPETSTKAFVWSFAFATWETDEIITTELYRNIGLAMLCVFVTTLLLIANIKTCLMVLLCVALTLIDVLGGMHFWNLTIDTISCVDLVLAIGLCVDYAAHIGHTFMTCKGTRNERARLSLKNIGPPVLNGGISTFLAFVLLANSKSHVFLTFYKIFFLVVAFGLFHGLVFLPVLLSLLGADPYPTARCDELIEAVPLNAPLGARPTVAEVVELNET